MDQILQPSSNKGKILLNGGSNVLDIEFLEMMVVNYILIQLKKINYIIQINEIYPLYERS